MQKTKNTWMLLTGAMLFPIGAMAQENAVKDINQSVSPKIKNQMENKIYIGKVDVPKASIAEFKKQAPVTANFLRTLPGYLKGEGYEMTDDEGDLHLISVTVWDNQQSYNNAQQKLKEYYEEIKFNRMEYRERLEIKAEYSLYVKDEL